MKYIILSPSNSTKKEPAFWRANNCGYTTSPFAAGIYTEEQIMAQPDYYNNGHSSIAIPLTDGAMTAIKFKVSLDWDAADQFLQKSHS